MGAMYKEIIFRKTLPVIIILFFGYDVFDIISKISRSYGIDTCRDL
ncbi:hypothetical protein M918_21190 [Clostridium sp. BL8]|nr:hypothetical protein M918_21190 [Clostridium sp. BL8]